MIIVFVESTADCFIRILYRINRENKSAADGVAFEAIINRQQARFRRRYYHMPCVNTRFESALNNTVKVGGLRRGR